MIKEYPDISASLKQKELRRRRLAQLSFAEKIAIVERLQTLKRTDDSSHDDDSRRQENLKAQTTKHPA